MSSIMREEHSLSNHTHADSTAHLRQRTVGHMVLVKPEQSVAVRALDAAMIVLRVVLDHLFAARTRIGLVMIVMWW